MKSTASIHPADRFSRTIRLVWAVAGLASFSAVPLAHGDTATRTAEPFGGIYKVAASSDPIFPVTVSREFFLDFGKGVQAGKLSGSVSISMRENPNVKVRILAWQYFPEKGSLVIGHPFSEGSSNAVARAVWQMRGAEGGVIFERGNHQVVLHRADPNDY